MDTAQLPQDDPKASLLQHDATFRQLVHEHHTLDEHVRQLAERAYLTDDQQREEAALKKRKLALKDQIEARVRAVNGQQGSA